MPPASAARPARRPVGPTPFGGRCPALTGHPRERLAKSAIRAAADVPYPPGMAVTVSAVAELCGSAREASRALAVLDTATKDAALHAIAHALEERTPEILDANARD